MYMYVMCIRAIQKVSELVKDGKLSVDTSTGLLQPADTDGVLPTHDATRDIPVSPFPSYIHSNHEPVRLHMLLYQYAECVNTHTISPLVRYCSYYCGYRQHLIRPYITTQCLRWQGEQTLSMSKLFSETYTYIHVHVLHILQSYMDDFC